MRIFITVLVLIFSLQSWTKADEIGDFQIEQLSVGDSLLDHFSEEKIEGFEKVKDFKDKKYTGIKIFDHGTFEEIQIMYKTNDNYKTIEGISAIKDFDNNLNACKNERKSTINELKIIFKNAKLHGPKKKKHIKQSEWEGYAFIFKSGDMAILACYYSKKDKDYLDHMRVSLRKGDYDHWLVNKAYK